ncbi:MAG: hypothetical protein SH857_15075 [Chitinophagales bacterium]|nr:hypothetical protein [Chitinophagales bacterium]
MKSSLIALLLVGSAFIYSASAQEKKEVLLMEIHSITGYSGIYLHWQNKETEFIDTEKPTTKTKIKEQWKILRDVFQRLYDEGWKIENSSRGYVNDAEVIQYVLIREK